MKIDSINQDFNIVAQGNENKSKAPSFAEYFKSALDSVNETQVKADNETQKLIDGESPDVHQALIAAEEARIQIQFAVQIRNKLVESYQEVMRMPL